MVAEALALSGIHHSPDGRVALRSLCAPAEGESDVTDDASLIADELAFTALLEAPCDTPTLWLAAVALEQYWGRELADALICPCTSLAELLALPWIDPHADVSM